MTHIASRILVCAAILSLAMSRLATAADYQQYGQYHSYRQYHQYSRHSRYTQRRPYRSGTYCGIERASFKHLADPQAATLPTYPRLATVHELVSLPTPANPDNLTHRFAPLEVTLWKVVAYLIGFARENDSDYHLILEDPTTHEQMIAEIPAPFCVTRNANVYARERKFIDEIHRPTSRYWWLDYHGATPPLVTVTGYGFADRIHQPPQHGVAKNGAELHPLQSISFASPRR